jgi:DNA-binding transcriptional MocR family regulator
MTEQRIDELADVLLRHYDDERNMPLIVEDDHSGDVANAYAVSFAQRLPDHVVHIRSFSKSHGPDLRLAALSGTDEIVGLLNARRRLGPGWVSRFLQEILSEMLTDKRTFSTVISARHTYATRQRTMNALLRRQGLDVHTGDGLNMWVPVRDDARRRATARRKQYSRRRRPALPPALLRRS